MKCSVMKREDFTLHFISTKVRKKKGFNVTSEDVLASLLPLEENKRDILV